MRGRTRAGKRLSPRGWGQNRRMSNRELRMAKADGREPGGSCVILRAGGAGRAGKAE